MSYVVAVAGATGNVGREILNILDERKFPISRLDVLASRRSQGREVSFGDKTLKITALEHYDFSGADIALFACGSAATKEYAPKAAAAGCVVIDNSSLHRLEPDVPLIVPEVNADAISGYAKRNIIANPNCSTAQLLVALKPLHDAATIKRLVIATYQSVSGRGKEAMDELFNQTRAIYVNDPIVKEQFTKQIAFNVIPHCDDFVDDGYTKEEMKMNWETRKIFGDDSIEVSATCVRIPVFYGHSEAVQIETHAPIEVAAVRELLEQAAGVEVIDTHEDGGYPTAVHDSAGQDSVFVGRIRQDISLPNGLNLWVVADNVRKGAALNSIQIAEELIKSYL